jgi:signal transduction histidine kinase
VSRESNGSLDFRVLFESVPGLYLVLAPDLTLVAVSDAYLAATMTRREAILGRHLFDVFPDNPADGSATGVSNLRNSLELVLRHKQPNTMAVQKYDVRAPSEAGGAFEQRYWSPTNSPVLGATGEVEYIIHSVADVTDFVRLKRYDQAQIAVNQELESRAGQMEAEIYRRAQEIQTANQKLHALQLKLQSRVAASAVELNEVSEALRRRDEQLRQSQKLEAIGHLAGGVAHDFNNLLSVILSYAQISRWNLGEAHPVAAHLSEIERAGSRAAELTHQLLAFSRRQVLDLRVLDLNEVVDNVSRMLRRLIGEDIEFRSRLAPNLGKIQRRPGADRAGSW